MREWVTARPSFLLTRLEGNEGLRRKKEYIDYAFFFLKITNQKNKLS